MMIDIPMAAKGPLRLSELDTARFAKAPSAPSGPYGLEALGRLRGQARPAPGPAPAPAPGPAPAPSPAPPPAPRQVKRRPPASGTPVVKGQKTSLSQLGGDLDLIEVALGWELGPGGQGYELDAEAFLLDQSGRALGEDWFVFYNQPVSPDGAVRLLGEGSAGDDAVLQVSLGRLHSGVARITFILTISQALERGFSFRHVHSAYVRIVDRRAGRELLRFPLTEYYDTVCSMVVGELYRYKNEWRFNPVGDGTGEDLAGLCRRYGIDTTG